MDDYLSIAIPKGTLYKDTIRVLREAGLNVDELETDSRKLFFVNEEDRVKYIICRPTDIPTFVEYGAADLGFVGKDTIVEQNKDVYELLDLKYGACRFVVAVPEKTAQDGQWEQMTHARVATKFPRVAQNYFAAEGKQMEIIKLHGNIELAPLVGLSEMIVDIVSTGRTLRENNLVAVAEIFKSTARLIANRVSHRLKNNRINPLIGQLKEVVGKLND
ncbi:ATP phosphoribosyltransferase [Thermincola ferriacetica]|uniref:ATP phosphoribosyltransferase n=1 Tax=Thermincola ferriacetica TaxID=281456 RepID=A0A0L6W108_9FIRM|nr:ATP phosphoribosyltransferase [Thermincola ferriacetica]KNZ69068.1 ATP phosphoribosyltransferase [Thermincola ferriacetica]